MKNLRYFFISMFSLATLFSCSERDDIRNDINDLNARLDKIESALPQMNQDISNYQGLLNGQLLVMGYTEDEKGNYVVELSNGTELTVYSGEPNEALPVMSIGSDGYWYYTINDETFPLLDNDKKVSASPEDGKTPQFGVNEQGMWEYSYDGVEWQSGIGLADPGVGNATVSIFDEVTLSDDKTKMTFKWTVNDETLEATVPIYGVLSLIIKNVTTPIAFNLGETQSFEIEQKNVDKIVIETMNWTIKVNETHMTVPAPTVNPIGKEYEDKLVLKIYSKEGYCKAVTIPVKLAAN